MHRVHTETMRKQFMAIGLVALGLVVCAVGIYIGDTDDAPGAALAGIVLMIGAVILGVKIVRRKI